MSQHNDNRTRTASTQVQVPAFSREAAVTTYWPPSPPPERFPPASEVTDLAPSRLLSAKFAYTATGEESLSYRIDSDDTAVGDARHLVTAWLDSRSMPALSVADAALATTELVTNAVVHGRPLPTPHGVLFDLPASGDRQSDVALDPLRPGPHPERDPQPEPVINDGTLAAMHEVYP